MKLDALALAIATLAAGIIVAAPMLGADPVALPEQEIQDNISYMSGGVGKGEASALKRAAAGYPLELQFVQRAMPRDESLADVSVKILDRSRTVVLDVVSQGPLLLARLPAGTYQIEADHDGVLKRQSVEIRAGKHERAVFVWAPPYEMRSMLNNASGSSIFPPAESK